MQTAWQQFEAAFWERIERGSFVKITFSGYKGKENLKNIYVKKVLIRGLPKMSFTFRYKTNDIIKNFNLEEALTQIDIYFGSAQFNIITLFSLDFDEEISVSKQGVSQFKQRKPSQQNIPDATHDKVKQRKITSLAKPYLHALQITDADGKVYKNAQDKYKQINHYIEILSSLFQELSSDQSINVADMGSGKGYLTFALYDYLTNELQKNANITGVEYREDMVKLCNQIAQQSQFANLNFEKGSIADYDTDKLDVLIALHACDTATDDAIAKGIKNNASIIVVAPCCHKQIRKSMKQGIPNEAMDFLLKYGLFLERQAEMITDSIRCMFLEYFGYQTKVVDFIADLHTPKNVLVIGKKKQHYTPESKDEFLIKLRKTTTFWGIDQHYLETVLF